MQNTSKIGKNIADACFVLYHVNGQGNNKRWGCQLKKEGHDVKPGDGAFTIGDLMKIGVVLKTYGDRLVEIANRSLSDVDKRECVWQPKLNYIVKGKLMPRESSQDTVYLNFEGETVRLRKADFDRITAQKAKKYCTKQ